MANPPPLFNATAALLALLAAAPCSSGGHPSHPLDHPGRQSAAGGLQTSNFPQMDFRAGSFFFLFWREAEKSAPLGSCCPRLLKTLGGLRPTQEASGCWLRPEPLVWVPPPTWGLPNSPLRSMLPSLTHLTDSLAQMPAQPQGLHRTMRPHLQGMSVNPGALHRAADRGERQQIPG